MSTRNRRVKWHSTPPPPSPKIINLPRRYSTRRRKTRAAGDKPPATKTRTAGDKLESLLGVEREFTGAPIVVLNSSGRRDRVVAEEVPEDDGGGGGDLAEERWKFQAEILRAECNFLRMERKLALKKLEKNRVRIERTLKSALDNLATGRKKLCEGKNMKMVLEEEMKELAEKLEELQSNNNGGEDSELRKCKNFDKNSLRLQRRLEKLGGLSNDEISNQIKNETRFYSQTNGEVNEDGIKSTDVEMLERKMKGLSTGMLDRMEEEYGSVINSSVASSASTSKRIDFPDHLSFSNRFSNHVKDPVVSQETNNRCSGRCKMLVRRIVEQVRAETEQWSQMQDMLGQLRQEMEELQTSKDFWETQALASNQEIQSLMSNVEEWKEKAIAYETKANNLETEVSLVKGELEKLKKDQVKELASTPKKGVTSLSKQIERETKNGLSCGMKGQCDVIGSKRHDQVNQSIVSQKHEQVNQSIVSKRHEQVNQSKNDSHPLSLANQLAREKKILVSRSKENRANNNELLSDRRRKVYNLVRSPFKDIGNSSSSSAATGVIRQNCKAVFPLHCRANARIED